MKILVKLEGQSNVPNIMTDKQAETITLEIGTKLFVIFGLDDLYVKDRNKAFKKFIALMDEAEQELFFEKRILIETDFLDQRKYIFKKLKNINDEDTEEMIMILFYIVHSFESMVNNHISIELTHKHFSHKEIKKIIFSLSTEAKLGWFLKLICGKDYTKNKNWPLIDGYIKTRNFYIHYKPETSEIYYNHEEKLSKTSIRSFLKASYDCYKFLNKYQSKEAKDFLYRVSNLKTRMKKDIYEEREKRNSPKEYIL